MTIKAPTKKTSKKKKFTIKFLLSILNLFIEARKDIIQRYKLQTRQLFFLFKKKENKVEKIIKKWIWENTEIIKNDIEKIGENLKIEINKNKTMKEFFSIPKRIPHLKKKFTKTIYSFERNDDQRHRIKVLIEDGVDIDILYRLQLFASVILATFGLLTNSNPVIIWAMLIAPLLQPIQALSFAIATWRLSLYWKSLKFLWLSILFAIVWSFVLTSLVPFGWLTSEILARTTPTVLDLWVAFASGIIAFLVLGYKKLSGTIVGAAIAASLLPPLCATWIWFKFVNWSVAWWTFLLFLANLVAIIFAGLLMFRLYKFKATRKEWKDRKMYQLIIMIVTAILISVPLWMSMKTITQDISVKNDIETSLNTTLPTIDPHIQLVSFTKKEKTDKMDISIIMKVPDWKNITIEDKSVISKHLASILQSPVDVTIEVIAITSVYIPKEVELSLEEKIHIYLADYIPKNYEKTYVIDFVFKTIWDKNIIVLELYNETPIIIDEFVKNIQNKLQLEFKKDFIIRTTWQIKEKQIKTQEEINELEQELKWQFIYLFPQSEIRTISIKEWITNDKENININIDFISAKDKKHTNLILQWRKEILEKKTSKKVFFNISVLYKDIVK